MQTFTDVDHELFWKCNSEFMHYFPFNDITKCILLPYTLKFIGPQSVLPVSYNFSRVVFTNKTLWWDYRQFNIYHFVVLLAHFQPTIKSKKFQHTPECVFLFSGHAPCIKSTSWNWPLLLVVPKHAIYNWGCISHTIDITEHVRYVLGLLEITGCVRHYWAC